MSRVSVVIPTKNRPQDIMRCLESILNQSLLPDEVVIVDSSDTDELKARPSIFSGKLNINLIAAKVNLSQARNIGIDNSMGDIVAFVDDDDILDRDYLKAIKSVFDDDSQKKVGGVTGEKITQAAGLSGRILLLIYQIFARVFLLWRYGDGRLLPSGLPAPIRPGTVDKPVEVEYVVGYSMAFRSGVLNDFRFDESLPHFDDDDISYRVSRKYQILYVPGAKFAHHPATAGGHGGRIRRMMTDVREFREFSKKNLPQTLKHKLALHWAASGYIIGKIAIGILGFFGLRWSP